TRSGRSSCGSTAWASCWQACSCYRRRSRSSTATITGSLVDRLVGLARREVLPDLLGGLAVHPGRLRELVDAGLTHRAHAAEVLEQALATRHADARDRVELRS